MSDSIKAIENAIAFYTQEKAKCLTDYTIQKINETECAELTGECDDAKRAWEACHKILDQLQAERARLFPNDHDNSWIGAVDRLAGEVEELRQNLRLFVEMGDTIQTWAGKNVAQPLWLEDYFELADVTREHLDGNA